jgi:catechol 2,3-dioxygenase-like lactoylglutathione lyase family enzyme
MASISTSVRYIVDDVDAAVAFYCTHLGFEVDMHPGPGFAALSRDGLRLLLNQPGAGGAGRAGSSADGSAPEPGGWNRFQLTVDDLGSTVARLRGEGVRFRGDVVEGRGGDQVLVEDPSGNPVELLQPADGSPRR